MIFLKLLWSFTKIGFTSFGGLSLYALISTEMLTHGWMTAEEIADIIAIAEMTPGPLGFNCATYAGFRAAGFLGALAANLGILMPCILLTFPAAVFFARVKDNQIMKKLLVGIRPAGIGLVLGVIVTQSLQNYFPAGAVSFTSIGIGLVVLFLLVKCNLSVPKVICVAGALGFLINYCVPALL